MKKLQCETKRLNQVIESDRLCISIDTSELIVFDLTNLLSNYFNLSSPVKIKINTNKDTYLISIETKANSIKPYGIIK